VALNAGAGCAGRVAADAAPAEKHRAPRRSPPVAAWLRHRYRPRVVRARGAARAAYREARNLLILDVLSAFLKG